MAIITVIKICLPVCTATRLYQKSVQQKKIVIKIGAYQKSVHLKDIFIKIRASQKSVHLKEIRAS